MFLAIQCSEDKPGTNAFLPMEQDPIPQQKEERVCTNPACYQHCSGGLEPPALGLACPPRPGAKSEAKALGQMLSTDLFAVSWG